MNVPAERTGKSTGDLSPFVPVAGTFAARLADAGVISRRTDGSTGPAPGKRPESPGGGSKRTVIWGMSVHRAKHRIERTLASNTGPFIVGISLNGDVTFIDDGKSRM
jgi:hypothetical protein